MVQVGANTATMRILVIEDDVDSAATVLEFAEDDANLAPLEEVIRRAHGEWERFIDPRGLTRDYWPPLSFLGPTATGSPMTMPDSPAFVANCQVTSPSGTSKVSVTR